MDEAKTDHNRAVLFTEYGTQRVHGVWTWPKFTVCGEEKKEKQKIIWIKSHEFKNYISPFIPFRFQAPDSLLMSTARSKHVQGTRLMIPHLNLLTMTRQFFFFNLG